MTNKTHNVLVVDDDSDDQLLIKMAFEQVSTQYRLQFASNGVEGLSCIENSRSLPDLILLDLNMPVLDGFEMLHRLKQSTLYRYIPIIILTTSDAQEDIKKAYDLGANSFLTKPSDHQALKDLAKNLHAFWFDVTKMADRLPRVLAGSSS